MASIPRDDATCFLFTWLGEMGSWRINGWKGGHSELQLNHRPRGLLDARIRILGRRCDYLLACLRVSGEVMKLVISKKSGRAIRCFLS
jgi:hypothetical protein